METLFGLPIDKLTIVLLAIFGVGVTATGVVALRNRVMFRIGIRNIPRRRSQTMLIVLGLMLATLLFSAALSAGDTLTHSIRTFVLRDLGRVDVVVRAEDHDADGRHAYIDGGTFDAVRQALEHHPKVDGIAPLVREYAPVVAPAARLSEPWVPILGVDEEWMAAFDRLEDREGNTLSVAALADGEVYVSRQLADALSLGIADSVQLFLGTEPATARVAAIYEEGAHPAGKLSVVLPIARLQALAGHPQEITEVLISNKGDALQGAEHSDAVRLALEPVLEGTNLASEAQKQDALAQAESDGNSIATIFFVFAQFSVGAGIMLIFLLFVMLASERKRELGISRAVGAQQNHVVQAFTFEGAVYALIAAAVGSVLGVGVGLAMVYVMGRAFANADFELAFAFRWRSVVIAYALGMTLTFAVVLLSSWRVSRLNIVRAIRDIPEPRQRRRRLRALILCVVLVLIGVLFTVLGLQAEQATPFGLGISLLIIGLPLAARWVGLGDRVAFSIAGVALVTFWLVPADVFGLPDMEQGIEIFLVSGFMLVIGTVLAVMYNADLLIALLMRLFGRFRGLAPVIKTALTYPMHSKMRTGITLGMFTLIVFTLTMMAFVISANDSLIEDVDRVSGGFQIRAYCNSINPIKDLSAAIEGADTLRPEDLEAVATFSWAPTTAKQEGSPKEFVDTWIQGHDEAYAASVNYQFALMAGGFDTPREVWRALHTDPGTAVVASFMVPTRNKFSLGSYVPDMWLEGVFLEDDELPEIVIMVQDPRTQDVHRLRVIGVLAAEAGYVAGITVSQETLNGLVSSEVPLTEFKFRVSEGADVESVAKAIESTFLEHGMQSVVIADELREIATANRMMNTLLEGFMSLGLVVGIAALGVVAARSVVERRQQIGILRALGFQKRAVQGIFLMESSFVALLGITLGVLLGALLAMNLINEMSQSIHGLAYRVPWLNIAVVVVIAFGASLLTTFLPARGAAKVYPAEALRFE